MKAGFLAPVGQRRKAETKRKSVPRMAFFHRPPVSWDFISFSSSRITCSRGSPGSSPAPPGKEGTQPRAGGSTPPPPRRAPSLSRVYTRSAAIPPRDRFPEIRGRDTAYRTVSAFYCDKFLPARRPLDFPRAAATDNRR